MGIRQTLNNRPMLTLIVASVAALLGIVFLAKGFFGGSTAIGAGTKEWFTIDDGKTYFAASGDKQPPFEYKGKTAYRCRVWTCDGKTRFVSHLERLTAEARKTIESTDPSKQFLIAMELTKIEVKAPMTGDTAWVPITDAAGQRLISPKCPNGEPATVVFPD